MIYPYMLNNLLVPPNCRIVKSFALFSIENSNNVFDYSTIQNFSVWR